jgi:CRP/FNR family transcriptional regulator, cyclic AMP receptor protein
MSNVEVKNSSVDVAMLLDKIVEGKSVLTLGEGQRISFEAGDTNAIYFIAAGQVKITVVSSTGKEAVLALLGPHEFFSEGGMVGRSSRARMATGLAPSTLLRLDRRVMLKAIQDHPDLREKLMNALLLRNMSIEEDLCDQFFNQSEKRLARALLKLARSKDDTVRREVHIPALSHETLAEMIGTSRSYITRFMTQFRRMGLIDYPGYVHDNPRLIVRTGLLSDKILQTTAPGSGMRTAA